MNDVTAQYPTRQSLEGLTVVFLASIYNKAVPGAQLKKFTDKKTGLARVWAALEERRKMLAEAEAKKTAAKIEKKLPAADADVLDVPAKTTKPAKPAVPKTAKTNKPSVAARMRGLILDGKTNAEVWEICQREFNLPDVRKTYPAWYRRQLNKGGKV